LFKVRKITLEKVLPTGQAENTLKNHPPWFLKPYGKGHFQHIAQWEKPLLKVKKITYEQCLIGTSLCRYFDEFEQVFTQMSMF